MNTYRVIHRNEPKEAIFKALVYDFFKTNPGCDVATVSITQDEPKRTEFQSRLYHLWVDILRKEQGEESKEEFKKDLAERFLGDREKSSKDLTIPEFVQYLKDIDSYFAREWGIMLPRNEDYHRTMSNEHKA
jgi:hypothetical protein|tara:strand:- start:63 stop:458 length:396 start_codon:yes stop_codon:yes gene_type:complete